MRVKAQVVDSMHAMRVSWNVVAVLLIATTALAQSGSPEVEALERRLCDARGYVGILSEDFVQIAPTGSLEKTLRAGPCRDLVVSVRDDAALATGVLTDTPPDVRFLHVWHLENGKWVVVLAHLTPIAKAAEGAPPAGPVSQTVWPTGQTPDEAAILETQRALNETFAAHDGEAYAKLTADGFVRVTIDGATMSRQEFIAAAGDRSGPPRRDPNHSEFRVRVYRSIATLMYFNRAADQQRVTRVLVRENGRWRQLHTQATRVLPVGSSR